MGTDFLQLRGFTEAGYVFVFAASRWSGFAAPRVIRSGDSLDVLSGQFAVDAVYHFAEFTGINEQG
jgi:hypothetical protein